MSLFERVRNLTNLTNLTNQPPTPTLSSNAFDPRPLRVSSALAGGSAALVSMLIIALPVLVVWVASPKSTVDWPRAMSVGSCLWLLANGASLSAGAATISLTPLLGTFIPLVVVTIAARRILVQLDDASPRRISWCGGLRRDVAEAGLTFVAAYSGVGVVAAVATGSDPLHSSVFGALVATAVLAALSVLTALALELRGRLGSVAPELTSFLEATLPIHVRRGIRPGLWGALAIFGAGLVLTIVMVVRNLGQIGRLSDTLGADPVGMVILSAGQLLLLPNVALWAASWMAGPGFGFGLDTAITWSHSDPGLLPLIPGLGALPAPGSLPAGLWLSALVPVAAGVLVGRRALRVVSRLSTWRVKANVAGAGCLVAALVLTLASALAGGSVGAARLSGVGAPSLLFGVSVFGEMLLGAAVVVGLSHLRAARS